MTERKVVWVPKLLRPLVAAIGLAAAAMVSAGAAHAQSAPFKTLYSFPGGYGPAAGLVIDKVGNLYGTKNLGAAAFKVSPSGAFTTLHEFTSEEGSNPQADLLIGGQGFFYGVNRNGGGSCNCGTVFQMTPGGVVKVLYTFVGGSRGSYPSGKLARDAAGNLYGTTGEGGYANLGTVFKLSPGGTQTVLFTFTGRNGSYPSHSSIILDDAGNLYGTTSGGGVYGHGIVFKLSPSGQETILHNFQCCRGDGDEPSAGVIMDAAGNLYGTLTGGGANGAGSIFMLTPAKKLTRLFSFAGTKGANPGTGLTMDAAGNLYGTTPSGGASSSSCNCGVAYKLAPGGQYTVLHTFERAADGGPPVGDLVLDKAGNLYGTTIFGGGQPDAGTVFRITN